MDAKNADTWTYLESAKKNPWGRKICGTWKEIMWHPNYDNIALNQRKEKKRVRLWQYWHATRTNLTEYGFYNGLCPILCIKGFVCIHIWKKEGGGGVSYFKVSDMVSKK